MITEKDLANMRERGTPLERQAASEIEWLRAIVAKAAIAVDYHNLGYRSNSDFDADTMIRLMDELGAALDKEPVAICATAQL